MSQLAQLLRRTAVFLKRRYLNVCIKCMNVLVLLYFYNPINVKLTLLIDNDSGRRRKYACKQKSRYRSILYSIKQKKIVIQSRKFLN